MLITAPAVKASRTIFTNDGKPFFKLFRSEITFFAYFSNVRSFRAASNKSVLISLALPEI